MSLAAYKESKMEPSHLNVPSISLCVKVVLIRSQTGLWIVCCSKLHQNFNGPQFSQ